MLKRFPRGHLFMPNLLTGLLFTLVSVHAVARGTNDTLRLTLPEAEKIFMEKNLSLLASKYNIDVNKALVEQARLWDNPVLVTDQNIYADGKFFAHGKDADGNIQGQYFIQVQQLIKTAGKRSKWVAMAATNVKMAQQQFDEVMRNLRYQLRTDYYTIQQRAAYQQLYTNELNELKTLLTGMEAQLKAGNIAQKDYLRVQALILSMQQDMVDNNRQMADAQSDLRNLLQNTDNVFITVPPLQATVPAQVQVGPVMDTAMVYNSAFAIERSQLVYQQQNLAYQQALKAPDLTIGPEYDHNSNYAPHYVGLSISLPLNILNKNQGNIKSARFAVKQEETTVQQVQQQLLTSIQNAINKLYITAELSGKQQQDFYNDYEKMFVNITDSYRKRQISLIEFVDFFEAYRDTKLKWIDQQLNLQLAKEEVNFLAGKDVIN